MQANEDVVGQPYRHGTAPGKFAPGSFHYSQSYGQTQPPLFSVVKDPGAGLVTIVVRVSIYFPDRRTDGQTAETDRRRKLVTSMDTHLHQEASLGKGSWLVLVLQANTFLTTTRQATKAIAPSCWRTRAQRIGWSPSSGSLVRLGSQPCSRG